MKTAEHWKDFEIIATGGGEKLERWGNVLLLRPDPQAIWKPAFCLEKHPDLNAIYNRSASGGGAWTKLKKFPDEWVVEYRDLKFIISPMNFKHTGLFPEQAVNWEKTSELINKRISNGRVSVLNLFGYTGGATVAAAKAGAVVTHVDASRGMVEVCKRNCKLNDLPADSVRFIVDDCVKFVEREIRRGKTYDAIIMDPPSFGRGPDGEVWKIEESLDYLVAKCCELLSPNPLFFLINSYTAGLQPTVIKNVLGRNLGRRCDRHSDSAIVKGFQTEDYKLDSYEIGLPTREGIVLPAGCSALATFNKGEVYEGN